MFRENSGTISGMITAPDGGSLTFFDVEDIFVNYPVFESGRSIPMVVPELNLPEDALTVVVKGLPKSVVIKEGGVPRLDENGEYFQVLDISAAIEGIISLDVRPGFFGDLNLDFTTFYGDSSAPEIQTTPLNLYIAPTKETALFAQAGDYNIDTVSGQAVQGNTPLDIVVSPLLGNDARITLFGIPSGVSLQRPDGSEIVIDDYTVLTKSDLVGLSISTDGVTESFEIGVTIEGEAAGYGVRGDDEIFVAVSDVYLGNNGNTITRFTGNRDDYTVTRIGNALEIASISAPEEITRVNMVGVDHLRFDDGFVSSRDYSTDIDLSSFLDQSLDPNTLIVISGLPDGTVPNNSIPVDTGVFAIPSEICSKITLLSCHIRQPSWV